MAKKDAYSGVFERVHEVVAVDLRNLYTFAEVHREDAVEVRLKHRGGGDWLVIVKRVGSDGAPQVLFTQAYDFVSALVSVDRGLEVGQWREDRPYVPPGED